MPRFLVPVNLSGHFLVAYEAPTAERAAKGVGNLIDDDGWEEWLSASIGPTHIQADVGDAKLITDSQFAGLIGDDDGIDRTITGYEEGDDGE